jgi:hypothetical protein
MATKNPKTKRSHVLDTTTRLAGGFGPHAAKQSDEMKLRRLVMANLLWEDLAYCDGEQVAGMIQATVPLVPAEAVAAIAKEARFQQKLRHVPLLLAREMARHASHKHLVAGLLPEIIRRPDEASEFLSIYWATNDGKKTLSAQVKKGLAAAMGKFDEYQLDKWNKTDKEIKLRDVVFLSHPKPRDVQGQQGQEIERKYRAGVAKVMRHPEALLSRLINDQLKTANTWEVGMSAAKSDEDKKAVWEGLITTGKMPSFALLKNLRNMTQAKVSRKIMAQAFETCRVDWLLPIDFIRAKDAAPDWSREIEQLMFRMCAGLPKFEGWSVFVVDVSGSMNEALSGRTEHNRIAAAASMCILATEMCEHISVYATAGNDTTRVHKTAKLTPVRGFALANEIDKQTRVLGGGGIFTRQVCDYIREHEAEQPDRTIFFTDSQDCDLPNRRTPVPPGKRNYIIDVSAHSHGVNYAGKWDAEISGWSEAFLKFIAALEGAEVRDEEEADAQPVQ